MYLQEVQEVLVVQVGRINQADPAKHKNVVKQIENGIIY